MKCVCGYSHDEFYDDGKMTTRGDQEFINIEGSFHIHRKFEDDKVVSLKACPKCKTIQMCDGW